jgi:WD40 repeat protein
LQKTSLASIGDEGIVRLWDSDTGACVRSMASSHANGGTALAFSPCSKLLMCSVGHDKRIIMYDAIQGQ